MGGISRELSCKSGKAGLGRRLLLRRRIVDNGCWEYTGNLDRKGYGRIRFQGFPTRAVHRFSAWVWLDFDIDSNLMICHRCDNPKCFNPNHLFKGTASDNIRDSVSKNRFQHDRNGQHEREKTHCPKGHPYSSDNTYVYGGSRNCKICTNARNRARYAANRNCVIPPKIRR